MGITIGSNIASLRTQGKLNSATKALTTSLERLSSGQRINRASDDAAGLSVSSTLRADTRVFNQAVRNVNDGVSALNIADQAIGSLTDIVTRQRELAEQSANGVYSNAQRTALNTEAQALAQEYSRIIQTTKFNGRALIDGSTTSLSLQAGIGADAALTAQIFFGNTTTTTGSTTDNGTTTNSTFNFDSFGGYGFNATNGFLIGDLNGDGISDIAALSVSDDATSTYSFEIKIFIGKANGTWGAADAAASNTYSAPGEVPTGAFFLGVKMTDVNADGKKDITMRLQLPFDLGTTLQAKEQFINTTVGTNFNMDLSFGDGVSTASGALSSGGASIADFNGDGINDNLIISGNQFSIQVHNTTTTTGSSTTTVDDLAQSTFSIATQSGAQSALTSLSAQQSELSQARGRIGAALSRLSAATNVLQATSENYASAESRITSADIGAESANATRLTIVQNAATAVLAQANVQPQIALMLLRG